MPWNTLHARLGPGSVGGLARGILTAAELRMAYHVAYVLLTTCAAETTDVNATAMLLLRLASQLRRENCPNPRYPQIRREFVSMLTSELDSYTCWRCARTSHSHEDVEYTYCGACHLPERTDP